MAGGWSAEEVERIVAELRAGGTVMFGGSRCHTTYFCREGVWMQEQFDEGYTVEYTSSEEEVRGLIHREPGAFAALLKAPHWRRFMAALQRRDAAEARSHLHAARVYGDSLQHGVILDAWLAWPEASPSEEARAEIVQKLRDYTAYHVWMDASGWDRGPENGRRGVEFVDRLIAMVGEVPGCWEVRASYQEQAGDRVQALADVDRELAVTAPGDWRLEGLRQRRERLWTRLQADTGAD